MPPQQRERAIDGHALPNRDDTFRLLDYDPYPGKPESRTVEGNRDPPARSAATLSGAQGPIKLSPNELDVGRIKIHVALGCEHRRVPRAARRSSGG